MIQITDTMADQTNNSLGIEIDCLTLIDPDEIGEIWTEATINELNNTPLLTNID